MTSKPHPRAWTLGSRVMEWKLILQGTYALIWMIFDEWLPRYELLKNLHIKLVTWTTGMTTVALLVLRTGEIIRAVKDSVARLNHALPIKLKCIWLKKMNSNSLGYEDVLYFDFQPHPIACTLGSVVMERKQTLFQIWMLSDDWLMWYNISLNRNILCDFDLKVSEWVGVWGWYRIKL